MTRKSNRTKRHAGRRQYRDELKTEAVQMLLDGHRAAGPPTNASYRSEPNGPLPLVAQLCQKVNDV